MHRGAECKLNVKCETCSKQEYTHNVHLHLSQPVCFLEAEGKPEIREETFMNMQNSTVTVTQAQDQTWFSERAMLATAISNSGSSIR